MLRLVTRKICSSKDNSIINSKRGFHLTKTLSDMVTVDGHPINYEISGSGKKATLCLPGALGTIQTDFGPQMKSLAGTDIQLVAWDPPGYGKSRPPSRNFSPNFFHQDAEIAAKFMKTLGYTNYSLLGWSDGGITALILASKFPKNIEKLVVFGANAYITQDDVKLYEAIRDINKWSERMRAPLEAIYGRDYFKLTWENWVDAMTAFIHNTNGDICKKEITTISCPTLIIHGVKDAMVSMEHPHYIHDNIQDSELVMWDDGKHNLHLKYADRFNALVSEFILKETKKE